MLGNVLLKRQVRTSKNDPLVDEVELIHATPCYARVRLPSGRETTVSLHDIAPTRGKQSILNNHELIGEHVANADLEIKDILRTNVSSSAPTPNLVDLPENVTTVDATPQSNSDVSSFPFKENAPELRRSTRTRRVPDWLTYYK